MHASPPFQMIVGRFGVWQGAAILLVSAATATAGAWSVLSQFGAVACVTLVLLFSASVAVLLQARRLRPTSLRWDTQNWHLGPEATAGHEPQIGRLIVAMDLGAWMMLRFVPDGAAVLHLGTWLPVQRRGHEHHWHALRCAVYCARPVSLPVGAPF